MRFHPFPIPLSNNTSLLPKVQQDVLATSKGTPTNHGTQVLRPSGLSSEGQTALLTCNQGNDRDVSLDSGTSTITLAYKWKWKPEILQQLRTTIKLGLSPNPDQVN